MTDFTIYVTGGSGFVGQHLVNFLIKNNISFEGYSRKKANNCKVISNYHEIKNNKNAVLIHLAQSPFIHGHNYHEDIETCKYFASKNWKHLIYLSSTLVYGDQNRKQNKSTINLNDITYDEKYQDYIKVKLESEKIFYNAGATCLRVTNIYGNGMNKSSIILEILKKAKNNQPIEIDNCETVRDFISIYDVVNGIYCSAKQMKNSIYNLATGNPMKIHDLAKLINLKVGNNAKVICKNSFFSQIMLDISKTKKELEWKPVYDISDYLDQLVSASIN